MTKVYLAISKMSHQVLFFASALVFITKNLIFFVLFNSEIDLLFSQENDDPLLLKTKATIVKYKNFAKLISQHRKTRTLIWPPPLTPPGLGGRGFYPCVTGMPARLYFCGIA